MIGPLWQDHSPGVADRLQISGQLQAHLLLPLVDIGESSSHAHYMFIETKEIQLGGIPTVCETRIHQWI